MILAIDIGNTTIDITFIKNEKILISENITTDISEIKAKITEFLKSCCIKKIDGAIISSVVPAITELIKKIITAEYGIEPLIVSHETTVGIKITTDEPEKVGSDRIADAVGGVSEYGFPLIIIDMGTATTISIINENKEFMGGMILPGVATALNSLINNTAQLPQINLNTPPQSLIGRNTTESIKSGIIYGAASCIDGICKRISDELGFNLKIVATGGNAEKVIPLCHSEIILDKRLLLKGLNIIFNEHGRKENA